MKIVADQNIPYAEEAFRSLGEVITVAGSDITAEIVKDADILLVRSVTPVNESLLAGSSVRFVGTATIGRDHVDEEWLHANQIGFASAPASNANSVAEWVITAMALAARDKGEQLAGKTLAIVGVGNIGTVLCEKAEALGMNVILNDPPLAAEGNTVFVDLEPALRAADYVSFHVPLTYDGNWPTAGMINDSLLSMIRDGAVVINAARGRTMVEEAVLKHAKRFSALILDVWPQEPIIDDLILETTRIGAPHIAGYSWDGKCNGTGMIYRAATSFFFQPAIWDEKKILSKISTDPILWDDAAGLAGVMLQACDLLGDDDRLRKLTVHVGDARARVFSRLRKEYPRRYEFCHYTVKGCKNPVMRGVLEKLGFGIG